MDFPATAPRRPLPRRLRLLTLFPLLLAYVALLATLLNAAAGGSDFSAHVNSGRLLACGRIQIRPGRGPLIQQAISSNGRPLYPVLFRFELAQEPILQERLPDNSVPVGSVGGVLVSRLVPDRS